MSLYVNIPGGGDTTVTLADATNIDLVGFNGMSDGDYIVSVYIPIANSITPTITVQPNQITSNQIGSIQATLGAGAPSTSYISSLMLTSYTTDAAGTPFVFGDFKLTVSTGYIRRFTFEGMDYTGTSTNARRILNTICWWTDTTTNITSLRFNTTVALSMKAGARFVVQRTGIYT